MLDDYLIIPYDGTKLVDISRAWFTNRITTDMYELYSITNWISPEDLAYNFYGSCDYVWIIILLNDIIDPWNDWLKTDSEVLDYCVMRYGKNVNATHHYEYNGINYTTRPKVTGNEYYNVHPISYLQHELEKNEKKRTVKVLKPEYLDMVSSWIKANIK